MASSVQTFRGKGEVFNDLDLLVLLQLMLTHLPAIGPEVREHLILWKQQVRAYAPGLLDLELEEALSSDEMRAKFVSLLIEIRHEAAERGEFIDAKSLNTNNEAPGITFGDFPVKHVIDAARRLEKLIS